MKEMAGVILYRHKVKILDSRELGKLLDMLWNLNWVQTCLAEKKYSWNLDDNAIKIAYGYQISFGFAECIASMDCYLWGNYVIHS